MSLPESKKSALALPGTLHLYPTKEGGSNPVFESADQSSNKVLIFLPGLFDGIGSVPYVSFLSSQLEKMGWSLAQPHLTSAYKAFGRASLQQDADEIEACVDFLKTQRGKTEVALMGHSTGCQQIMRYLVTEPRRIKVDRAILQAPVSDREAFPSLPSFPPTFVPLAAKLYAEGQRDELIHGGIDAFGVDVTVYRAWSLVCEGGDDDYFSLLSPLPHSTTFAKLPTSTPILFLFSSHDEYTPNASTTQPALLKAWLEAVPKNLRAEGATLEGGHALKPELGEMGVSKGWEGLGEEVRKWLS